MVNKGTVEQLENLREHYEECGTCLICNRIPELKLWINSMHKELIQKVYGEYEK